MRSLTGSRPPRRRWDDAACCRRTGERALHRLHRFAADARMPMARRSSEQNEHRWASISIIRTLPRDQAELPRRLAGEAYPFEPSDAVGTGQQEDDRGAACGKFLRQRRVHRGKGGERGPVNGEAYRNDDVGL